jgi:ketosteroid isomerase-like protein
VSQANVEVIKRCLDASNRGDFAAAIATTADDVVLVVDERVVPHSAGVFTGRDAVGDWFADWFRSFARGYQFHIQEMRPIGKRVFLVLRHRGRGRSSGVVLEWSVAYVYTIKAGRIARIELFSDLSDALKAAGLEESAVSECHEEGPPRWQSPGCHERS